jgi:phytanoyl-CoA hydroxylase
MAARTGADLEEFAERGYIVVPDLVPRPVLQDVHDEYNALLGDLAQAYWREGKIRSTYEGLDFPARLMRIIAEGDVPYYKAFDVSLRFGKISADDPIHLGPAVFRLLTHRSIVSVLKQLIGPEIYASPVQHARIKPPERLVPVRHRTSLSAKAAWHQDQASVLPEADDTEIITAWVAVTDSTVANGGLVVIPGSHHDLITHCSHGASGRNLSIPDALLPGEPASLEVTSGSVIFMHRRLVHGSHVNVSDTLRWSFDFRYQPTGKPTGRPQFPGFIVSSRKPGAAVNDPAQWAQEWLDARTRLSAGGHGEYRRWTGAEAAC